MVRTRQEPEFNISRFSVWDSKISGKKTLFSKFWHFLLIWASLKCYFWIPHLKIMPGTNFHENITSQTQIITVNATLWYSKMASFRKNEGILVQICKIHISVTIQVRRLKFGTFPYLSSTNLCAKFYGFLETWVSDPYYLALFDVEFPTRNFLICLQCLNPLDHPPLRPLGYSLSFLVRLGTFQSFCLWVLLEFN